MKWQKIIDSNHKGFESSVIELVECIMPCIVKLVGLLERTDAGFITQVCRKIRIMKDLLKDRKNS